MRIKIFILCLALSVTAAHSATFLKIEGIPGDSQNSRHRKEVEIVAFQLTGNRLSFTKKIDVASPALFLGAAIGRRIPSAVLTDGPETDRRVYTFEDIVVTELRQRAGWSTAEEVTFIFTRLKLESNPSGSSKGSAQATSSRDVASSSRRSANTGQSVAIFMKADPIQGSSTDPRHQNEMVTKSLEWGIRSGSAGGRMVLHPFDVQKALDMGSDRLMQYSQTGQRIAAVKLTLQQQGADFYIYTLGDVRVSDYSRTGSGETFKLQYGKIEVEIKTSQPGSVDAPLKAGWDVKANKKV